MDRKITDMAAAAIEGGSITREQAMFIADENASDLHDVMYWANRIRREYFGDTVRVCSIVPGRLGGCNQDCKFCAQSVRYKTAAPSRAETLGDEEVMEAARKAKASGVGHFGIVYSGRAVSESELCRLEKLIARIRGEVGIAVCAGLGIINDEQARRLAAAGAERYNHNLETSEEHFPSIVTTHTFAERFATIRAAQAAGMGICGGGIFGIGEAAKDRVSMAIELRGLGVDTVPMNFLHPIEGTPLAGVATLAPRQILRIIALYRFMLPKVNLKVAGGRVLNLRDMQSWIFYAGATSILSGNYLTTAGRSVGEDMQMLADLGLRAI